MLAVNCAMQLKWDHTLAYLYFSLLAESAVWAYAKCSSSDARARILVAVFISLCVFAVCVKAEQRRHDPRYSPPPGMLPSCDRLSQGVTALTVSQSTRGGGLFLPVENDVSTHFCCLVSFNSPAL